MEEIKIKDNTKDEVKEFMPSPIQSRFAKLYLDASKRRTHEMLAAEIGIHRNTVGNWLRNPEFSKWLSSRRMEILDNSLVDIYKTLVYKAMAGDFNSMKLVLEMSGCYTPGMKIDTGQTELIRIEVVQSQAQIATKTAPETITADKQPQGHRIPLPNQEGGSIEDNTNNRDI